ncbi:MAG: cupredoxin domain-containing protein [Polyangiales bacterium]
MLRQLSILSLGAFVALSACSSSDSGGSTPAADTGTTVTDTGTAPTDTGSGGDDTGTATDDTGTSMETGGDTGPAAVQGCTTFVDATTDATLRTIKPWNPTLGTKCLKIKKGQAVTWEGVPTTFHPLEAAEGDTPSPITNTSPITFPNEGTFGFHCTVHPTLMKGAIMVVP